MLLRLFHDLDEAPTLFLAQRPGLHDPHRVANACGILLVMGHELRGTVDKLPIDRMLNLAVDSDRDRLLHLIADDLADPFLPEISFVFHPVIVVGTP